MEADAKDTMVKTMLSDAEERKEELLKSGSIRGAGLTPQPPDGGSPRAAANLGRRMSTIEYANHRTKPLTPLKPAFSVEEEEEEEEKEGKEGKESEELGALEDSVRDAEDPGPLPGTLPPLSRPSKGAGERRSGLPPQSMPLWAQQTGDGGATSDRDGVLDTHDISVNNHKVANGAVVRFATDSYPFYNTLMALLDGACAHLRRTWHFSASVLVILWHFD